MHREHFGRSRPVTIMRFTLGNFHEEKQIMDEAAKSLLPAHHQPSIPTHNNKRRAWKRRRRTSH